MRQDSTSFCSLVSPLVLSCLASSKMARLSRNHCSGFWVTVLNAKKQMMDMPERRECGWQVIIIISVMRAIAAVLMIVMTPRIYGAKTSL